MISEELSRWKRDAIGEKVPVTCPQANPNCLTLHFDYRQDLKDERILALIEYIERLEGDRKR